MGSLTLCCLFQEKGVWQTERPFLFKDFASLRRPDKVKCIPTEKIENESIKSRQTVEIVVPIVTGIEQDETGRVITRTRTERRKQE